MRGFSDSGNLFKITRYYIYYLHSSPKLYNKVRYKKFDLSNYIRTLVKNVYVTISFFIIINLFLISYL